MADTPPGVKFTFLDYVALGFILPGAEEFLRRGKDAWTIWLSAFLLGIITLVFRDKSPQITSRLLAWFRAPKKKLAFVLTENAELKKQMEKMKKEIEELNVPIWVPPSKLTIHSALYRAQVPNAKVIDVAECLRQKIAGDGLVFQIQNANFRVGDRNWVDEDPCDGEKKWLQVEYSFDGRTRTTVERREDYRMVLPEDTFVKGEMERIQYEAERGKSVELEKATLRSYDRPVFTVEKVIPEGPATSPTVYLKNKIRIILTNHLDTNVSVWTPLWESPEVKAEGSPPGSTIQLAKRGWEFDEWEDERHCVTVASGRSFRSYIALLPTTGDSIYRRFERGIPLGALVFPVKIDGKLYQVRQGI